MGPRVLGSGGCAALGLYGSWVPRLLMTTAMMTVVVACSTVGSALGALPPRALFYCSTVLKAARTGLNESTQPCVSYAGQNGGRKKGRERKMDRYREREAEVIYTDRLTDRGTGSQEGKQAGRHRHTDTDNTQTHRHRDRDRDRQTTDTDRKADRHTHKCAHAHTEVQCHITLRVPYPTISLSYHATPY